MDPKTRTMRPHQSWTPEPASRSRPTLRIPRMPILIMPPDMRADTLDGASGCAWGSQECSGMIPAFAPNPKNARTKHAEETAGPKSCVRKSLKLKEPPTPLVMSRKLAMMRTKPTCAMTK